jgi:beta-lactamase class A
MSTDWTTVAETVAAAETQGTVGVCVVAPDGERWQHNGDRQFRAASTVKIPIMVELFRQVERGARSLDDRHVVRTEEKAPGSGVLLHLHDGLDLTLNDLVYLMISISDNSATNILIDLVGMEAVNATMRDVGMSASNLSRAMKGRPAIAGEVENLATPDDYAAAVSAILDGRAASRSSCQAMRAMLEKQQNARRIARYLPQNERIRWGSKTGSIEGVTNDVGFISADEEAIVIAVFCEGFPDQHDGERAIGEISRAALAATGLVTRQ